MKILFLTGVYTNDTIDYLQSNCRNIYLSMAANVYQWAVIRGLVDNNVSFEVLSFPFLPCFPIHYKKLLTPNASIIYEGRTIGEMARYSTLMIYKYLSIKNNLRKRLNDWLLRNYSEDEKIIILTYTPDATYVNVSYEMKKQFPRIEICAIVTELVDFTGMAASNKFFLKKIQMDRERKATIEAYNKIDKFVLLTQAMEELVPQAKNKNIVVEGIYSPTQSLEGILKTEVRKLVYTGSLQEYVGIKDLVKAFVLTKSPKYKLIICGSGSCESFIQEKSKNDSRIEFRGSVSRDEALQLQAEATALINPRHPSEDFTKYSFPSKTMEYLASGTPMIGYVLPGMPSDYVPHIYVPDDLSIKALSRKIDEVLSLSNNELKEKADKARSFILNNKTSRYQVRRILEFLKN